ncbi:DUF4350 domain-containing protein [Haloarchaeobius iranensis]|uniref:DUF4350 domain-containing protein n=1 Tax=Haloarchaeobius iranensis TaxID=996166 RepID=A0A1H0AD64_9EURY|nr:DUF4350 domain-containing protein [Haloarchaeobius iranensis]SDN31558.1 protein of unknown function [Haloarchaeobius iranensis]
MRIELPQYVLLFIVGLFVVSLLWAGSTSTAAFGGYNPAWDGSRDARVLADEGAEVTVLQETSGYDSLPGENTTAVVLSPSESYDASSRARFRSFVERGGTLVVAGDFDGGTNELLAAVGAESRVDGRVLRDERFHGASPALPVATNISESQYTESVGRVALNYPSVVDPGPNATTIVASSNYSYLDTNGNDALDDSEQLASYPVVTTESVGAGTVIAVSDPSLFINTMLEKGDNRAFATNLFAGETVAFDYSHSAGLPPLTALVLDLRSSAFAQFALGALVVALGALAIREDGVLAALGQRLGRSGADSTLTQREVLTFLRDRHPEWEEARVERLAQSINLPSRNEGDEQ